MRVMRLVRLNALASMFIPTSSELRSPFSQQLLSTVHQLLPAPHILRLKYSSAFSLASVAVCFSVFVWRQKSSKRPLAMKCFFLRFLPLLILELDVCLPSADQLPPSHFLLVLQRIIDVRSLLILTLVVCFCLHHCRFFIVVFPCCQLLLSLSNVFHLRLIHCASSLFLFFRTVDFLHEIF